MACMLAAALPAETLVWTGEASSDWNLADLNWTNELGEATAWVNGSDALFPAAATSPVSVTGDVELHNLRLAKRTNMFTWSDGGGSLTFVSDGANPTNYIRFGGEGLDKD